MVGVGGHAYRGCYVIGDSRLNFLRSSYLRLPATLKISVQFREKMILEVICNLFIIFFIVYFFLPFLIEFEDRNSSLKPFSKYFIKIVILT